MLAEAALPWLGGVFRSLLLIEELKKKVQNTLSPSRKPTRPRVNMWHQSPRPVWPHNNRVLTPT